MKSCCYTTVLALLVLAALAFASDTGSNKTQSYQSIDQHALKATAEDEESLASLAKYLVKPCKTEREKVRAIYRWITDRIAYDVDTFLAGKGGDDRAAAVLKNRKVICEGSANLFIDLCKRSGIKSVKIEGYAKGNGYVPGTKFSEINHAWNAVSIDGKWYLLDSTWGAGTVEGKKFDKAFSDFYFLTPPERLIYSHFPKNEKWQLLDGPISKKQFTQRPLVNRGLLELGVSEKSIRAVIDKKSFREFVQGVTYPDFKVVIVEVPLNKHLEAGSTYEFTVKSDDCTEIVAFNGSTLTDFVKKGNVFRGTVKVNKGELIIGGAVKDKKKEHRGFLEYRVD